MSLLLILTVGAMPAVHAQPVTQSQEYRQAIEQARAGGHARALEWLAQQAEQHPLEPRIRHDQLIVAGWAGRHQEVMRLHQSLPANALPLPKAALAAAARAYRDGRIWPTALTLYQEGMRRYPGDPVFSTGEVGVLADSGETAAALAQARQLVQEAPDEAWSQLALSYAHRRAQQPYAALASASRAYLIKPDDPDVLQEYIDVLVQGRMAGAALRTARAHPGLVSPEQMRRLEGDRAAELTRLASMPTRQETDRYAIADQALARYDQLTPAATSGAAAAPGAAQRARIDRLLALHARSRMQETVQEYEALQADGITVPYYALGVVADAYLDQRKPDEASELYLQILNAEQAAKQTEPSIRLSHQSGLFYSFVETERFDEALAVANAAQEEQPPWLHKKGTPLPHPNDLSLEASHQAAMGHHYADDTEFAQERLEQLVAQAPGHSGLRSSLSQVYMARGWPRRAESELKIAETQTPLALSVLLGQAHAAMALQEWKQAETLVEHVQTRFPENAHVKQLQRDWERHNRAELTVTGYRGLASDSPVAGNGDFSIDTAIYTPPIDYNWRGFAGGGYANADFEGEQIDYHWYRAGAEWRSRGLTVEGEVSSHHYGQGAKTGARLQGAYQLDDQWSIGGQYAFRSRETPLRALANDITSNRLDAQLSWKANDRRQWSFTFSPSHFSDGNRRMEASISGQERLYTSPHVKLDGLLDVYASRNTREDAPYFNPRADLSVLPALALTHILHRRYENVLEQRFMVGAGIYSQRHYGSGAIMALGYGLRYRFNEAFNAGVSVTGISRPYDGQREREAKIMFDLQIRF